ncbi:MAG: hydroxymethylbilane synthase [Armatimonadota bacterium]
MKIRAGSRSSLLALIQTREVLKAIKGKFPHLELELVLVKTTGDKSSDPLDKLNTVGIFTKEIEEQLLKGRIDIAVHSLKDLPTALPKGLAVGAVLKRSSPMDVLVSLNYSWDNLPGNAVIGTGSLRRRTQLSSIKPEVEFKDLRGNIDTRLEKIRTENLDGIICAHAALIRLNIIDLKGKLLSEKYADYKFTPLPVEIMIPAVGQGIIGIEFCSGNEMIEEILKAVNHRETFTEASVERSFLAELGGGCMIPAGGLASVKRDQIELEAFWAREETASFKREKLIYPLEKAHDIGPELAKKIKGIQTEDK